MQFSDTTNKNGLIQDCEFWTGLGDARISGNATLLKVFTNLINRRADRLYGRLGVRSPLSQTDDTNYDNHPFSTFAIASGTHDYQFLETEDGEAITDITAVMIQRSAADTDYYELDKLTLDTPGAALVMSPNSDNTGIPTGYIERNNTVFFNRIPDYNAYGKVFFKRSPSYFTSADTTKVPGFDAHHHRLLSLGASYDWILVNKAENTALITRLESEIERAEREFESFADMRNPTVRRIVPAYQSAE